MLCVCVCVVVRTIGSLMTGATLACICITDPNAVHVPDRPGCACHRALLPSMTWNKPAVTTSQNWLKQGEISDFWLIVKTFLSLCPNLEILSSGLFLAIHQWMKEGESLHVSEFNKLELKHCKGCKVAADLEMFPQGMSATAA